MTADTVSANLGQFERVVTRDLEAQHAHIGELEADTAKIHDLTADQLTATVGYIEDLTADNITAANITADHAKVGSLDANYARIDTANIDTATIREAWVDALMVQTGLISHQGSIFELDAIQVNASKIKAGTLDVERLVVTQDGQKYLVHVNAQGTPTYEKLDGNIIEDLTITADKIVAGAITAQKITTENIVGSGGWINLRNGTFNYINASTGEGISWDGSHLTLNGTATFVNNPVGGRNMLLTSGEFKNVGYWVANGNNASVTLNTTAYTFPVLRCVNSVAMNQTYGEGVVSLVQGETYVYHAMIKFNASGTWTNSQPLHRWVYKSATARQVGASNGAETTISWYADTPGNKAITAGKWHHLVYVFTANVDSAMPYTTFRPLIYGTSVDLSQGYDIKWMKLERGATCTDWTPAPEDLPNDLASPTGTTVIDGGHITANSLAIGNFNSTTQSSILNSNVKVGGRNLLAYSGTGKNWAYSTFSDGVYTRSTTATSKSFVVGRTVEPLALGETYTFSAWMKTNGQVSSVDMYLYDYAGKTVLSKELGALTTSWAHYTWTVTMPNSWTSGTDTTHYWSARFDNNGSKASGTEAILYVKQPKLETGNKATDWSPAPEDVDEAVSTAQTTANNAAKTATNYIYADSSGIRIASATPSTQNQRLQLTSSAATFYDSGGTQRLKLDSSSGVVVGNPSKGRAILNDNGLTVKDANNATAAVFSSSGMTLSGHDSPVGTRLQASNAVSRSGSSIDSPTQGASITLGKGMWIVNAHWTFSTMDGTGAHRLGVYLRRGGALSENHEYTRTTIPNGNYTRIGVTCIRTVTDTTEAMYVYGAADAAQQSGTTDATAIEAIRIA